MTNQQIDTIQLWKEAREYALIQEKIGKLQPPRPYDSENYPLDKQEYNQLKSSAILEAENQVEVEFKLIFPLLGKTAPLNI